MPIWSQHSVTMAGCGLDGQSSAVRDTTKCGVKPWVSRIMASPRRDLPVTAPISRSSRIASASTRAEMPGNKGS
ncbi:hypothetical protein D3C87_1852240 [compost metagenome]